MNTRFLAPFFALSISSFLYENAYLQNCKKNLITYLISLLHHIGSMYVVFGSLFFGYYLFHLIVVVITASLWQVFNDQCVVTIYYNKLCGLPKKSAHKDLVYLLNQIIRQKYLHHFVAFSVIAFDVYMLLRKS